MSLADLVGTCPESVVALSDFGRAARRAVDPDSTLQDHYAGLEPDMREQWLAFHKANPIVWQQFERFALEAVAAGRTRFSHWAVMQRVRWETAVVTCNSDFKIDNNLIAHYARFFVKVHPEHAHLFALRRLKVERTIQ